MCCISRQLTSHPASWYQQMQLQGIHSRRGTPVPEKKSLVVHYNKQTDKAEIRSVTHENI